MSVLWLCLAPTVAVLLVWIYLSWKTRRMRQLLARLPGPPCLPILGNTLEFVGNSIDVMNTILALPRRYPSTFRLWLGPMAHVVVTNPAEVQQLCNNPKLLTKSSQYQFLKPLMRNGIFTASGSVWKAHRKMMMPVFNQKVLNSFVEIFAQQADVLLEQMKAEVGKGAFDAFRYTSRCTVALICETTMGVKINAQAENAPFLEWVNSALRVAFKRIMQVWLQLDVIFNLTSYPKQEQEAVKATRGFIDHVIKLKKEEYARRKKEEDLDVKQTDESQQKSILDLMIELSNNGSSFTDDELRDEVTTIIMAGSDTTAIMLGYTLVLLAMHPEHQEKVYEEVMNTIGPHKGVEHTDLKNLAYTERVIKETLRIFPAGPFAARLANEDIHMESYTIPAGAIVVFHIIGIHRDPKIYPDPMKFDPDRFLPEEVAKRHPCSWIPFLAGPRNCIGMTYGMMQMKTVLAHLVRRYRFKTTFGSIEEFKILADFLVKPVRGHLISIENRE